MTMFYFQVCFFSCLFSWFSCCHLLPISSIFALSYVLFVFHVSIVIWFNNYIRFIDDVIFQNSFIKTKIIGVYNEFLVWFLVYCHFQEDCMIYHIPYLSGLSWVIQINRSLKNIWIKLVPLTLLSILTIILSTTASLQYGQYIVLSFTITTSFSLMINFDDINFYYIYETLNSTKYSVFYRFQKWLSKARS